jgi:hypothetical protein
MIIWDWCSNVRLSEEYFYILGGKFGIFIKVVTVPMTSVLHKIICKKILGLPKRFFLNI